MELWIRSQDKLLLEKVQTLKVAQYKNESFNELDFTFGIVVNNDYVFGDYTTKERALEVLDEIEGLLVLKQGLKLTTNAIYSVDNGLAIYEMPKE